MRRWRRGGGMRGGGGGGGGVVGVTKPQTKKSRLSHILRVGWHSCCLRRSRIWPGSMSAYLGCCQSSHSPSPSSIPSPPPPPPAPRYTLPTTTNPPSHPPPPYLCKSPASWKIEFSGFLFCFLLCFLILFSCVQRLLTNPVPLLPSAND